MYVFFAIVILIISLLVNKKGGCVVRGILCVFFIFLALVLFAYEKYWFGGWMVILAILSLCFREGWIDKISDSFRKKSQTKSINKNQDSTNRPTVIDKPKTTTVSYSPPTYNTYSYGKAKIYTYLNYLSSITDYQKNLIIEAKSTVPRPGAICTCSEGFTIWSGTQLQKQSYEQIRTNFLNGKIYDLSYDDYLGYVEVLCEDVLKALMRNETDPRYVWAVMKRIYMMNPNVVNKMYQISRGYRDEYAISDTYKNIIRLKPELHSKSSWLETALLTYKLTAQDYIALKRVYENSQRVLGDCPRIRAMIIKNYIQTLRMAGDQTCTKISTFYKSNQHPHHYYIYTDILHKCVQALQNSLREKVYHRPMTARFKSTIDEQLSEMFSPLDLDQIINKCVETNFPLSSECWEEVKVWIPALAKKNNISAKVITPARKHIEINKDRVSVQEEQFQSVVDKLNQIMEEEEPEPIPVKFEEITKTEDTPQNDILTIFSNNGFTLGKDVVNEIAKQQHTMPSALIDHLNEQYYELLDDVLVEEEGEMYVMNEEYYNSIKEYGK